jgi:hypothetical protein
MAAEDATASHTTTHIGLPCTDTAFTRSLPTGDAGGKQTRKKRGKVIWCRLAAAEEAVKFAPTHTHYECPNLLHTTYWVLWAAKNSRAHATFVRHT